MRSRATELIIDDGRAGWEFYSRIGPNRFNWMLNESKFGYQEVYF